MNRPREPNERNRPGEMQVDSVRFAAMVLGLTFAAEKMRGMLVEGFLFVAAFGEPVFALAQFAQPFQHFPLLNGLTQGFGCRLDPGFFFLYHGFGVFDAYA